MPINTCFNRKYCQSCVILCVKILKIDNENLPLLQRHLFNLFCGHFMKLMTIKNANIDVYLGPNMNFEIFSSFTHEHA